MEKVRLGKTGLMVSRVGMGGIPIQRPPFDEAARMVEKAIELGIEQVILNMPNSHEIAPIEAIGEDVLPEIRKM
jgi:hypothetical protein